MIHLFPSHRLFWLRFQAVPAAHPLNQYSCLPVFHSHVWKIFIWPTEGVITSKFGPRTGFGSSNHQGIDIGGAYGESITAADGGLVIKADWYYGYGLLVQIQHDNGDVTYYGHCSELLVREGDRVYQGQVIAHMGETGQASGVHLHFEIRQNDTPVNPLNILP
jgi:murein DD-endopeptidase MepM/ murein hydrolase activator NlpD